MGQYSQIRQGLKIPSYLVGYAEETSASPKRCLIQKILQLPILSESNNGGGNNIPRRKIYVSDGTLSHFFP